MLNRGYLNISLKEAAGAVQKVLKSNDLIAYEASRWFRMLVNGNAPFNPELGATFFRKGNHTLDVNMPLPRIPNPNNEFAVGNPMSIDATETARFRRRDVNTHLAPVFPNQIAFALGSAAIFADNTMNPAGTFALADFGLNQIGNVFGHPAGRRAFFNEPAIAPNGLGAVNLTGPLVLNEDENWHHIWDIRIAADGDEAAAEYIWQRRPYFFGSYEAGAGLGDFVVAGATDNLSQRFPGGGSNSSRSEPGAIHFNLIPTTAAPIQPTQVPYDSEFPTPTASQNTAVSGMVHDEQPTSRIWFAMSPRLTNGDANASNGRSLWSWKSYTLEIMNRRDAPGQFTDESLTGFPTLPTNVQFRNLAMTRAGIMLLACDGDDDDGTGSNNGALISIDVTAGNEGVQDVHGEAAGGIYTVGGLRQYNCLAVAVDRSENYAAAGSDRIWVLHRNGLSFADINNTTKVIGAWTTVADAGATVNILAANSIRGLANFTQPGASPFRLSEPSYLDVDSNGDVYFVTTATGGTYDTVGKQRVNRLLGDASAHTYYSVDSVAEGGAVGFLNMGATSGTTKTVHGFRIWRKDAADPGDDYLWISTGFGGSVGTDRVIQAIPLSEWGTGDNPGAGWFREDFDNQSANSWWQLHVDRANNVLAFMSNFNTWGILESFGRANFISGEVDQFDAPAGNLQTIHRNTGTGNPWSSKLVGKRIRIPSGEGTNPVNTGSFIVDSFTDADTIVIRNPGGAATAVGEAAAWDFKGTEFDTFVFEGTLGGTSTGGHYGAIGPNGYIDNTGLGVFFGGFGGVNPNAFALNGHFAETRQWSGSAWYRKRCEHIEAAATRTAHTTAEVMTSNVKVAFANQNGGVNEFFAGENYTAGSSPGMFKDATQEVTFGWDLYSLRTALIDERLTPLTAIHSTALGGFIDRGSLASVATDNPFVLTTTQARHLATYQKQLVLDGTNNTSSIQVTLGNTDATTGWQVGLDLGSDVVADKLRIVTGLEANNSFWLNIIIDVYSATQASGPTAWSLRASYDPNADYPEWIPRTDAFRARNAISDFGDAPSEWTVDLAALAANANLSNPATNDAMRYWKFVFRTASNQTNIDPAMVCIAAFDAAGDPIGVPAAKRIGTAEDTNYLANYIVIPTWLIDDDATAGGTISSAGAVVTLTGGTFSVDIANGDLLRELDGGENIVQEIPVLSRDSGTQITLTRTPDTPITAAANWEVVRIADVRPRDDEGGGENQPQFPASEFQVFVCPITGHVLYHDDAVTNARVLRFEKYVEVKRSL